MTLWSLTVNHGKNRFRNAQQNGFRMHVYKHNARGVGGNDVKMLVLGKKTRPCRGTECDQNITVIPNSTENMPRSQDVSRVHTIFMVPDVKRIPRGPGVVSKLGAWPQTALCRCTLARSTVDISNLAVVYKVRIIRLYGPRLQCLQRHHQAFTMSYPTSSATASSSS